jgi:hypothetical protein
MRKLVITAWLLAVATWANGQTLLPSPDNDPYAPTFGHFLGSTFGPASLLRAAAGAGIEMKLDHPVEWGQGAEGYGKRYASSFSGHFINNSVHYGVAGMLGEEARYHPSGRHGVGSRLVYAVEATFVTHKVSTGNATLNVGELAGAFSSGFISRTWQPPSTDTRADAFKATSLTLAVSMGTNVFKEFVHLRHHQ